MYHKSEREVGESALAPGREERVLCCLGLDRRSERQEARGELGFSD